MLQKSIKQPIHSSNHSRSILVYHFLQCAQHLCSTWMASQMHIEKRGGQSFRTDIPIKMERYISLGRTMFSSLSLHKNTSLGMFQVRRNKALKSTHFTWALQKCFSKLMYSIVQKGHKEYQNRPVETTEHSSRTILMYKH